MHASICNKNQNFDVVRTSIIAWYLASVSATACFFSSLALIKSSIISFACSGDGVEHNWVAEAANKSLLDRIIGTKASVQKASRITMTPVNSAKEQAVVDDIVEPCFLSMIMIVFACFSFVQS